MGRKAAGPASRHVATLPQDPDAREALAWLERGMLDEEIAYDDDAPRLTKAQLAEFAPARFVIRQRRK